MKQQDYDRSIHSNPDAMAWAKFYKETFPEADLDTIHGWFANAMMAMHDHIYQTKNVTEKAVPVEKPVMPILTDIEVRSGWEAWLNNSFKAYKKDFSDKLRKSNKRSGVIETPKKWIENYYKELLEITERYLNASKHSA